ncbi:unnamed protein product [Prunus armeniaca]
MYHLQKRVVFLVRGMRNSSVVVPSSAQLDELTKKNADMIDKLSNEQIRHDARMSEMNESRSELKSSLGQRDGEIKSIVATLLKRKEAYFLLEHKYVILAQSHDKLLAKFDFLVEAVEASKHEVTANAYKLGYLDCMKRTFPYCLIVDEDAK